MVEPSLLDLIDPTIALGKLYFDTISQLISKGDPLSIVVIGIILFVLLVVFFKVTSWVYSVLKRMFLLLVIILSFAFFMHNFGQRMLEEGTTTSILIVGAIGLLMGVLALIVAFYSIADYLRKSKAERMKKMEEAPEEETEIIPPAKASTLGRMAQQQSPALARSGIFSKESFSTSAFTSSLKDDRSVLAVLSYVIITEFGVFSSVTIAAPAPFIGMLFAGIFFVGAFVFIKTTYHSYVKGMTHLIIASIFGLILSILLGHFWVQVPLEMLLSIDYFKSPSLVAFVTGIAVSLFMGSRN